MSRRRAPARDAGFTLVEVLVAVVVFAVFGVMAYGGLSAVIRQFTIAEQSTERLREIQYAVRQITQDMAQLHPRPVRDPVGDSRQPALLTGSRSEFPLEFTRGGWPNLLLMPRPTLQRVAYFLEDDILVRLQWQVLDRTLGNQPLRHEILSGVTDLRVRLLDPAREWQEEWPPQGVPPEIAERLLPMAAELVIDLEDYGLITRLVELPR